MPIMLLAIHPIIFPLQYIRIVPPLFPSEITYSWTLKITVPSGYD